MKMTHEEVLAELNALVIKAGESEDFMTTDELCDSWEMGISAVRRRLKLARKADRLEVRRVKRTNLAGVPVAIPSYRVLSE